jgi:hypothetical protein
MIAARIIPWYYAASVLFLLLDFGAGLNLRLAFLEPWPNARIAYYGVCFFCLALMLWRPRWTVLVGTFESLVTLVALILGMAVRVMIPNNAIFAENVSIVTFQEIVNFLISGSVAYLAWIRGLRQLRLR